MRTPRREYQAVWKHEKDNRLRAARGRETWRCTQCCGQISYSPRGGNRMLICKTCAPDDRFRTMVRRYGVDKQMFEAMYFDQDGKCAITSCVREAKAIDHDHVTGRVRGLLCQGCNIALGFLESAAWMTAADEYLLDAP